MHIEAADRTNRVSSVDYINNTVQKEYFDPDTKTIRVETKEPSKLNVVLANTIEKVDSSISEHISASLTTRFVSPGYSATATYSDSGLDLGGGLATSIAGSLTLDLNISFPIVSPLPFAIDLGGSFTPPSWPSGTTAGVDFSWSDNGLVLSLSAGIGAGRKEFHLLFTDSIILQTNQ